MMLTYMGLDDKAPTPTAKRIVAVPRPRILAVDDQPDSLRLLEIRLRSGGMDCFPFSVPEKALAFMQRELVDVILLDVMMPGIDGIELCRRLKQDERTHDIPVLFLTAKQEPTEKIRALEAGGHDYLGKPVDQQELMARTRAALRVKQLQDQLKEKLALQQQVNQLHQGMLSSHWQQTFGQLAASLAHEINNPLAAAIGNVELLSLQQGLPAEVTERLVSIDHSLQRAGKKLRSLLLVAQSSQKSQTFTLESFVDDLLTVINFHLVVNKVTLTTRMEPDCRWYGREGNLARAVLYILHNAIEAVAGRPEPRLTLLGETRGGRHLLRVLDNGPLIPPEVRPDIFEAFFTTKPPPHNGLGLYLAQQIVNAGGGRMDVVCPSPEGEVEFLIEFPAPETLRSLELKFQI